MRTKNEIAQEIYGLEFADLNRGQKSVVTKEYNAQDEEDETEDEDLNVVAAEIGRVGYNGTKKCLLREGATVQDLLDQAGYSVSSSEKIIEQSTGVSVDLDDEVEDGETYVIAPEVKSA